jgi:hypothetical protein
LRAPRTPYHPSKDSAFRRGDMAILVVPVSAMLRVHPLEERTKFNILKKLLGNLNRPRPCFFTFYKIVIGSRNVCHVGDQWTGKIYLAASIAVISANTVLYPSAEGLALMMGLR